VIFGDASYFIALSNKGDRWHADALRVAGKLRDSILVTDLVVAESVTQVGSRVGVKAGKTLFQYFRDDCRIAYAGEDLLDDAMERWQTYGGRLSVSDAVSLAIMARERLSKILSFDSDFDIVRGIDRLH